jgi:hypothetical protein
VKRARALVALLAVGTCVGACGTPFEAPPTGVNHCSSASPCGEGAACSSQRQVCVATAYDLGGLLVEVRPWSGAVFGANQSFLFDPAQVVSLKSTSDAKAFDVTMSPKLPALAQIREGLVRVNAQTPVSADCAGAIVNRALPATVTFYRRSPFGGLAYQPTWVDTSGKKNNLVVDLVPDTYDVYVEPHAVSKCNDGLPFPPAFLPNVAISGGTLLLDLPVVGKFTTSFTGFGAVVPDDGWKVLLSETSRGFPISATGKLEPVPAPGEGYAIEVQISPPADNKAILRLIPPSGTLSPVGYWSVAAQPSQVPGFDVTGLYLAPVRVNGQVLGADGFTRVPALLSVQSTELTGQNAANAAYSVNALSTDENGVFDFFLPPGKFVVRAQPIDSGLAITDRTFSIQSGIPCFCGQSLQLGAKATLGGDVQSPRGERLAGAALLVSGPEGPVAAYFASKHSLPPLSPRQVVAETAAPDGNFSILVDPGTVDLIAQPPDGSSYPWLIKPNLDLPGDLALGDLTIPYPAILSGTVTDPEGRAVTGADVVAWFPVRKTDPAGGLTGTAVQIAATTTDASGNYTLLLPASVQ